MKIYENLTPNVFSTSFAIVIIYMFNLKEKRFARLTILVLYLRRAEPRLDGFEP